MPMTIFERILAGDLPASFVYRDASYAAFMDISPMRPGHVLVIPQQPVATLDELDAQTRAGLWELARRIGAAQRQALGSQAQHFLVNDGRAASQTVPHVHIHVIPRYGRDHLQAVGQMLWHVGTLMLPKPESRRRRERLDRQAESIRAALEAPPSGN